MKKIISILLVFIIILPLVSCASKQAENKEENDVKNTISDIKAKSQNIERVLNRKIFILKDTDIDIYTEMMDNINNTNAYKENWTYGHILTEKNFSQIEWTTRNINSGNVLSFKGTSKAVEDLTICIDFAVQNKEDTRPLALSFVTSNGIDFDVGTVEKDENKGLTDFIITDMGISCMIARLEDVLMETKRNWDFEEFSPIPFTLEEYYNRTKDPNWYDNGIFSTYIEQEYPGDEWEYDGSFNCNMVDNPYGYTGFQAYTHQCEEAQQVYYYLVPISPAGVLPEVYTLDIDEISANMKKVFIGTQ